MSKNKREKRKNSSNSSESKSNKGNKERKIVESPGGIKVDNSFMKLLDNSYGNLNNSVFTDQAINPMTSNYLQSPIMLTNNGADQLMNGQLPPTQGGQQVGHSQYCVSSGSQYVPTYTNLMNANGNANGNMPVSSPLPPPPPSLSVTSTPTYMTLPNQLQQQQQHTQSISNAQLMQFMSEKFDEVNKRHEEIYKRLDKLESLEQKVNDMDSKMVNLWTDVDNRVKQNTDNIALLNEQVVSNDFEIEKAREEVKSLRK